MMRKLLISYFCYLPLSLIISFITIFIVISVAWQKHTSAFFVWDGRLTCFCVALIFSRAHPPRGVGEPFAWGAHNEHVCATAAIAKAA